MLELPYYNFRRTKSETIKFFLIFFITTLGAEQTSSVVGYWADWIPYEIIVNIILINQLAGI